MKLLSKVLVFAAALTLSCATSPPPGGGHRMGSTGAPSTCMTPLNAVTGNSATIVIYDDTAVTANKGVDRAVVQMFYDQAVTILYQVKLPGSSTWRTVNGSGAGDAVTASTLTVIDFRLMSYSNRIEVVTGGTGPSVSETGVCIVHDPALAQ